MPNIKSAIKKMKQDVARSKRNSKYAKAVDDVIRKAKKGVTTKKAQFVSQAYSTIDAAAKKNVIHDNKASRLKARVSRLVSHTA